MVGRLSWVGVDGGIGDEYMEEEEYELGVILHSCKSELRRSWNKGPLQNKGNERKTLCTLQGGTPTSRTEAKAT